MDSDDGKGEESPHEMRAFMHMFMDLVGVFQDDNNPNQIASGHAAAGNSCVLLSLKSIIICVCML